MAKKSKRRRSRRRLGSSRHRNPRRSNPFGFSGRRSRRSYSRRRRNPGGMGSVREISGLLLWGTAGAIGSLSLPGMVASQYNNGAIGYVLNAATAYVGGSLVGKFAGPQAGAHFLAGGIIATGLRIFNNFFGSSFPIGLSGDMGYYIENSFPLPTAGQGPYLLNPGYSGSPMASVQAPAAALPAAAVAAVASTGATDGTDTPSRWNSRWAA